MLRRILLPLILLLSTAISLPAQDYIFNTMSTSDGFPSKVTSIYVPEKGFAWVGSDEGLVRLDNNSFDIYTHSDAPGSIPGNNVYKVVEDSDGIIWVLTDKGLCHYDKSSNSFIVHTTEIAGQNVPVIAYSFLEIDGAFIIGGENTIFRFDKESGALDAVAEFTLGQSCPITSIFPWDATHLLIHGKEVGFYLFDTTRNDLKKIAIQQDHQSSTVLVDSHRNIWASSYNRGLDCYNSEGILNRSYNVENGQLNSNIILCLAETDNNIWIGTDGGGISIIDKKSGDVVRTLSHERDDPAYLPSNTVLSLFCEDDNTIWAGRQRGGLIILKESLIHSYLSGDSQYRSKSEGITSLYRDPEDEGTIWVGTEGSGLIEFTPETGRFKYFPETEGLKIFDLTAFPGGKVFISTISEGFHIFDPKTEKIEKFETPVPELEDYVRFSGVGVCSRNDSDGRIYLIADNIYRYTPETGKAEIFRLPPKSDAGELHAAFSQGGDLYFHSLTSIYIWDRRSDMLEFLYNIGEDAHINSAAVGREGEIWLATEEGIGCYQAADNSYTPVDSFFFKGAQSIIYDAKGRIWVGSKNGMFIYYPIDGSVVSLGKSDGVYQNEYIQHARLKSGADIYFGGVKGLLRVDQSINFDLSGIPEISLADVYIDSKRVSDKSRIKLRQDYKTLDIDIFANEDNFLREKVYRFWVKGPRTDETFTSTAPGTAINYHIPGRYKVYASCTCTNGKWSDWTEILKFRVNTKWYFTWWALIGLVTLILLFSGMYVSHVLRLRGERNIREADEERIKFLVNVSHELRTPLTLVLGPLGRILKEMDKEDRNYESLANVNRQALRMKSLLNTVLTAHKIEEGASSLNLASRDLSEWIEHVVSGFRDEARGRDITIATRFDKNAKTLSFDDDKCQIVLSNILMNALKHSPSGTTITVSSEARPIDGMIRIAVADQGEGFTIKDPSKLFERFYQESGNSRNGFGIGLSYCKTIVEQHKGHIGAFNNEDGGATFYYDLPATMVSEVFNTTAPQPSKPAEKDPQKGLAKISQLLKSDHESPKAAKSVKELNILLVDDNMDFREYLRGELGHKVRNVIVAANGKEALELMDSEKVDIVLSDVMMPIMDGFELCRRIKSGETGHKVPVILLTARSDENSHVLGIQNGADGYLVKPFETDAMFTAIKAVLNKVER